jgi:hypothetical protein
MFPSSGLPAGTAGTGRVHPRRAAGTAGRRVQRARVDGFFFQNRTLPVSYSCPSRVHGYGYGGTRAHGTGPRVGRVLDYSGTGTVITISEPL